MIQDKSIPTSHIISGLHSTPRHRTTSRHYAKITTIFTLLAEGNPSAFFAHVSPTVHWTVMGTRPLAGTYHSISEFQEATFARLSEFMKKDDPVRLEVVNVAGGGEQEWAVTELKVLGTCKDGFVLVNPYA